MDGLRKMFEKPSSKPKSAPNGIMPKLNPKDDDLHASSAPIADEEIPQEDIGEVSESEERTDQNDVPFTAEELSNGFKMSVILGEPLGKRGWRYGRR